MFPLPDCPSVPADSAEARESKATKGEKELNSLWTLAPVQGPRALGCPPEVGSMGRELWWLPALCRLEAQGQEMGLQLLGAGKCTCSEFRSWPLDFRPGTFSISWGFLPLHPLLSARVTPSIREGCACAMDTSSTVCSRGHQQPGPLPSWARLPVLCSWALGHLGSPGRAALTEQSGSPGVAPPSSAGGIQLHPAPVRALHAPASGLWPFWRRPWVGGRGMAGGPGVASSVEKHCCWSVAAVCSRRGLGHGMGV